MSTRRELGLFATCLSVLILAFFHETLIGGKVLSPADVVYAEASFAGVKPPHYEPANRLLIDPVLQFQPWVEFNRRELRAGRLPLWNPYVGCGAPHLANGQSAVFDPFHLIAYLGPLPQTHAWEAAARLFVAGLGMFLLARAWGLRFWGRWFAGLTFPFCGFLVVWLQFPVTSAAVWMPWLFLATDRILERPSAGRAAGLALVAAFSIFGGHIQTTAHVLIALAIYVLWRLWCATLPRPGLRACVAWAASLGLGVAAAAVQVMPLGAYLARSPVWADRQRDLPDDLEFARPRLLDAACTAFPYLYGSQRRGHPNLARALGVHNLNESAGGFAGLLTVAWLVPLSWKARRGRPRVRFLIGLLTAAVLVAFAVPPFANVVRLVPVLNVIDHRRLTLWIAFALVFLGAHGVDALALPRRQTLTPDRVNRVAGRLAAAGAVVLALTAVLMPAARPWVAARVANYEHAAGRDSHRVAERTDRIIQFASQYMLAQSCVLAAACVGIALSGRKPRARWWLRPAILVLVLLELLAFGAGLNPAIESGDDRPRSEIINYLQNQAAPPWRVLGVEAELPPNLAMRYGLADCRNYDSVELHTGLSWFEPMYEPDPSTRARTSRRTVTWDGVIRVRERLRRAGVKLVVGAEPPPEGAFEEVCRVGAVWVVNLSPDPPRYTQPAPGEIRIDASGGPGHREFVPVAYDPGWSAAIDGKPARVVCEAGAFLAVDCPPGARTIRFVYDPAEVRIGLVVSILALGLTGLLAAHDALRRVGLKIDPGAWRPEPSGDRIDRVLPHFLGHSRRLNTEGCHADGPLHV